MHTYVKIAKINIIIWFFLFYRTIFFQEGVVSIWMYLMDTDKAKREKARRKFHKNATSYIE